MVKSDLAIMQSYVDYKNYFSYGEVQTAVATGRLNIPELSKNAKSLQTRICVYCGQEFEKRTESELCCSRRCQSLFDRLKYNPKPKKHKASTGRPPNQLWVWLDKLLPLWNNGFSDSAIGQQLNLADKYIGRIRRYFEIPANYGQVPVQTLDISDIEKKIPRDKRLRR